MSTWREQHIGIYLGVTLINQNHIHREINPLKTKGKLFHLKTQFVLRSKHYSSWL
jgi:hypothetical protein